MSSEAPSNPSDRRTEARRPTNGQVKLQPEGFATASAPGQMMDISSSGFRARHSFQALGSGHIVDFAYGSLEGRARGLDTHCQRPCGKRLPDSASGPGLTPRRLSQYGPRNVNVTAGRCVRRRLRRLHADYHAGLIGMDTVRQSVQAWIGHAMHGDTWRLREQIFEAFPFLSGVRPK